MQDICIQSKVIDIFLKFKMAAAAILDFQFMWIWPFRRVSSVVFVFCTKFGLNICYSHWDRRTYTSELLVTWSSLHGLNASSHEIWCRYLYPIQVIDIFRKLKMVAAAILDLFGWAMAPPTKPHSWCVPPVKILSWLARFSSYKDLNFFSSRLESPIHGPKISVFGGFYPQNLGAHR